MAQASRQLQLDPASAGNVQLNCQPWGAAAQAHRVGRAKRRCIDLQAAQLPHLGDEKGHIAGVRSQIRVVTKSQQGERGGMRQSVPRQALHVHAVQPQHLQACRVEAG